MNLGAEGQDIKERLEVTKRSHVVLSDGQWERSHLTERRWEPEKHKSWGIPVEGFRNHVATDGSLVGVSGKWRASGSSVVQLDHDEDGMYGTLEAELEVQHTTKRAELTAFLCLSPQESCRVPRWCTSTTKDLLTGCGEVK